MGTPVRTTIVLQVGEVLASCCQTFGESATGPQLRFSADRLVLHSLGIRVRVGGRPDSPLSCERCGWQPWGRVVLDNERP